MRAMPITVASSLVLCALVLTISGGARATVAIGLDGYAKAGTTHGSSVSATLSTAYANDVIIAFVVTNSLPTSFSCSDTASLTWHQRAADLGYPAVWEMNATSASTLRSDSITCTINPGGFNLAMTVFGVSGAETALSFDPSVSPVYAQGQGRAPTLSMTTSFPDFIVGLLGAYGLDTETAGAGFTLIANKEQPPTAAAEYESATAPGTFQVGISQPSTNYWTFVGDAIMPAASAPTSPNAQTNGYFGSSVAVNGSTAIVGAPGETANGKSLAGHAYEFSFGLASTFTSPNAQASGSFGWSVAVNGAAMVVGAFGETASSKSTAGHVYEFNTNNGALIRTFTSPNVVAGGSFGYSVAMSGSVVAVGAPGETANASGDAYAFNASTGALLSTLTSPNPQSGAQFGYSVAVSGSTVVVGANYESVNGLSQAGGAYEFNAKTGALVYSLISPNVAKYGQFGRSVAVNGTTLLVGAGGESANGLTGGGHAYELNSTTGALVRTLTSPNTVQYGHFGDSVALSPSTLVVGADFETSNGQPSAGRAYSFNPSTGALITTFTSPHAQFAGLFGVPAAVSGSTVIVGASGETAKGLPGAGRAYIF